MKLSKKQREELKQKFGGRCAYCGCKLSEKGWHADHVEKVGRILEIDQKARAKGVWKLRATGELMNEHLDTFENLFPACAPCNLFKGGFSLEEFRHEIFAQAERARAYSVNFRTAERFGQIQVTPSPVVFWFERYKAKSEAA
ncbi:HNH endonuclease [Sodalis ligni]|uniref:HNH endonuclease n=1 Tax=Sodalis ligni TaxID=2697027 RepID=UPI00193FAF61|nr:HNH endonuclease signature motif containing protein [Sodalis ligni]QWA09548.1 HNH endonuclease [Sodalis ligni]